MQTHILILAAAAVFCLFFSSSEGLKDYTNSPDYKCVQCLCHARTGCWRRQNCASYSISKAYWQQAGSPSADPLADPDSDQAFKNCMDNENCIVATILQYTSSFGQIDCNCDGKFDCKDRFAIHLHGENCENPKFQTAYAKRFNSCRSMVAGVDEMLTSEGSDTCQGPEIVY